MTDNLKIAAIISNPHQFGFGNPVAPQPSCGGPKPLPVAPQPSCGGPKPLPVAPQPSCGGQKSSCGGCQPPVRSCLVDKPLGNSNCHPYGVINYQTTLPCNRCNFTPLYIQDICSKQSNGCGVSYKKCVKALTCNNDTCNYC